MGVSGVERRRIIASGAPAARHSTNQHVIKSGLEGLDKLSPPRKAERAKQRKAKAETDRQEAEIEKISRIAERVARTIITQDLRQGPQVFEAELNFLAQRGIHFEVLDTPLTFE